MNEKQEQRMIGDTGYEVKKAFPINGKEILIAENLKAEDGQIYFICQYTENGVIGEYSLCEISDDYLEILQSFTEHLSREISEIQAERDAVNLPADLFTSEHCYPRDYSENIEGKVVAIRSDVLNPEYRRGDNQLVWVTGGFGAHGNSRGNAVYCRYLNNGKHTRIEKNEVLGVVRPEAVPEWAKESLAQILSELQKLSELTQTQDVKDKPEKQYAGSYEIIERIEVGNKIFALGHNPKAAQPYGTWEGYKNSSRGFNYGHYAKTYEDAKAELQARAGKEQRFLDSRKRSDKER